MKLTCSFLKRLMALGAVGFSFVAFAEDAYLESDGTQYIVTGYHPTEKMKLVADIQIVTAKASQSILGNVYGSGEGASFRVWMNGTPNLEGNFTSSTGGDIWSGRLKNEIDTNRHLLEVDYAVGKFALRNPDGTYADSYSPRTPFGARRSGTATRPLAFFTSTPEKANADISAAAMKLYSAQIYEEGMLIHDYVPCKKGDRIGLYDAKTGEFWGSATRQPAIGGDYMTVDDDPYVASLNNNVANTSGARAIFDTLYKPNAKTRVELDYAQAADYTLSTGDWSYMMSNTSAGNDGGLFGLYQNNKTLGVSMSMGKNSLGANTDQWQTLASVGAPATYSKDIRRTAILDNVKGKATLLTSGYESGSYTNKVHWYADRVHDTLKVGGFAGNSGGYAPMKIYGLKIYEDDVLLHDYKPMKSGSQGVLKDEVTGRTLLTMNADSPFSPGPNLTEEPYVESTGYQSVILDYKPNANTVLMVDYANLATNKSMRVFGTDNLVFWVNANGNQEYYCHSAWSGGYPAGVDGKRHTTVVDIPNSKIYYTDSTYGSIAAKDMTTRSGYTAAVSESTKPLALFNQYGKTLAEGAKVRIYSVNVYENGVLLHSYQPYVKGDIVGFKDAKTGNFFAGTSTNTKVQLNGLVAGGVIANDGSALSAYIESDQTQYILTDYCPTATTRLELDFQLTKLRNDFYILGRNQTPNWEFYVNGNYGYTAICHTGWDGKTTVEKFADMQRTKIVLDRKRGKATISRADTNMTDYVTFGTASTTASTVKLGLFARQESNGTHYPLPTSETGGMVPMRVFSLRIYEDDVMKYEYLPYQNGTTIGLKDTVTGKVLTSSEGNPFVVGGKGYEDAQGGANTFVTGLTDRSVSPEKSVSLSVFAPGAVRYEWTRGGVPLAATGDTVTLAWQRVKGDHTQEIAVTPVYNVYGTEVKGTPSTATLTNEPKGMVILFR